MTLRSLIAPALLLAPLMAACAPETAAPAGDAGPGPGSASVSGSGWRLDGGGDLNAFFDCLDAEGVALVSAHRGGPYPGYPENAVETFAALLEAAPALIEIDVTASADGVLYLMHDDTLERVTDGEGEADALDWRAVAALRLKDNDGAATAFRPARFDEALDWAAGRAILKVDFKRAARYEDVIETIRDRGAEARVVLIAYTLAQAEKLHRLAPEMMISLTVEAMSDYNRAIAAGLPADRLVAFTGLDAARPQLNGFLEERGVEVIFGTLGGRQSIDTAIARDGDEDRYADIAAAGVDVIATDRPLEAHAALAEAGRGARAGVCGVEKS